jgi:hypothetical protein
MGKLEPQEYKSEWYIKLKNNSKEYQRKRRLKILLHYSPNLICNKCGFNDVRALTIDHKNSNGSEDRKKFGSGSAFYGWIIKRDFPEDLQVLCMNCQWIKRHENNEFR